MEKTAGAPKIGMNKFFLVTIVTTVSTAAFVMGLLWAKVQVLERQVATSTDKKDQVPVVAQVSPSPIIPQNVANITERDHVRGDRGAPLALIEYSDLECPFCKQFHPIAQRIIDTYKGNVMWVYRHFPLAFHANAAKEAEASECAYDQGGDSAFWEYIDKILARTTSNGTGFDLDQLAPLGREIGLNEVAFRGCLESGKFTTYVQSQVESGSRAGITGTPGNIIVDIRSGKTRMVAGAVPLEQMKPVINEMLK